MGKLAQQAEAYNGQQQEGATVDQILQQVDSRSVSLEVLTSPAKFQHLQHVAKTFAGSSLVPDHFRNNPSNCFIALQLALRLDVDPFMLMQNMYVVYGRPGLQTTLVVSLFNERAGAYRGGVQYDIKRDKAGKITECTAWSTRKDTGEKVRGPSITPEVVRAEGWHLPKKTKSGGSIPSKWTTIPELMYRYRAAMWFVRSSAPQVVLGMRSVDELQDMGRVDEAFLDEGDTTGAEAAPQKQDSEKTDESDVPDDKIMPAGHEPEPEPKDSAGPEPKPEQDLPPAKQKSPAEKRVQVKDHTKDSSGSARSMADIMELMDMVGYPSDEFEQQVRHLRINLDDRRTITMAQIRSLEAAISGWADQQQV